MAKNTRTWILTLVLLATGCTAAPVIDEGPASAPHPPSTTTSTSTTVGQPATSVIAPGEKSLSLSSPTTVTTVTTEAPRRDMPNVEMPAINTDFDLDGLDDLVTDLNEVLADFDQSLAEEEGDIFND